MRALAFVAQEFRPYPDLKPPPCERQHRLTAREIDVNRGCEVVALNALRLESLLRAGSVMRGSLNDEREMHFGYWRDICERKERHFRGGLFVDDRDLVGTMTARPWGEDKTIAMWGGAYVSEELRQNGLPQPDGAVQREGLAAPLYKAREDWTRSHFRAAVLYVRAVNKKVLKIQINRGAEIIREEMRPYADGSIAPAYLLKRSFGVNAL